MSENGSYMETCYLLLYGDLPSKDDLKIFETTVIYFKLGCKWNDGTLRFNLIFWWI